MKEYIGSEEHFHDRVNFHYDEKERIEKEQVQQINKQIMSELHRNNEKEPQKMIYNGYIIEREYSQYLAYPEDGYYYDGEHDNAVRGYSVEEVMQLIDDIISEEDN